MKIQAIRYIFLFFFVQNHFTLQDVGVSTNDAKPTDTEILEKGLWPQQRCP